MLVPRHSEFRGRANSEARNRKEFREKMKFYGTRTDSLITLTTSTFYKKLVLKFWAAAFVLSSFLFRWRVQKGILRVCFYFCSTVRNSELFSLPLKCSEGNSESLLLVLFNGKAFWVIFSSLEGFGTESRGFSVPRNSRNSDGNNHLFRIYSAFHGINFLAEIPNPYSVPRGVKYLYQV